MTSQKNGASGINIRFVLKITDMLIEVLLKMSGRLTDIARIFVLLFLLSTCQRDTVYCLEQKTHK